MARKSFQPCPLFAQKSARPQGIFHSLTEVDDDIVLHTHTLHNVDHGQEVCGYEMNIITYSYIKVKGGQVS